MEQLKKNPHPDCTVGGEEDWVGGGASEAAESEVKKLQTIFKMS